MADITFSWARLTRPALALRQVGPWRRKISATSIAGRDKSEPRSGGRPHLGEEQVERTCDLPDRLDGDTSVKRRGVELLVAEQHPGLRRGRLWMTRMSVLRSRRWVAKLCRKVCKPTRLSIPARCAALWTARLSCRVVRGCPGTRPGNSHPLGRAIRHHCRRRTSRCCDSITYRSLRPLP